MDFGHVFGRFLVPDESERPLQGRVEFVPDAVHVEAGVDYPVAPVVAVLDERGRLSRQGSSELGVGLVPGGWTARFFLRDRHEWLTVQPVPFVLAAGDQKWITRIPGDGSGAPAYTVTDLTDGTATITSDQITDHGDGTATIQIGE